MQHKSAYKFISGQGHDFCLIIVAVIAPFKRDLTVITSDDTMIGDGYSMRICAKVFDDLSFHVTK